MRAGALEIFEAALLSGWAGMRRCVRVLGGMSALEALYLHA